jgi:hypothetical protein
MNRKMLHYLFRLGVPVAACIAGALLLGAAIWMTALAVGSEAYWATYLSPAAFAAGAFGALAWGGRKIHDYLQGQPDDTVRVVVPSPSQITVVDDKGWSWQLPYPPFQEWSGDELLEFHNSGKVPESVLRRSFANTRK